MLNLLPQDGEGTQWKAFCALAYMCRRRRQTVPADAPIVLLVLQSSLGDLRFVVHPEFRKLFKGRDLDYLDSLLSDFLVRSESAPDELFRQISSLGNAGPLVIQVTGNDIREFPSLVEMCKCFVDL